MPVLAHAISAWKGSVTACHLIDSSVSSRNRFLCTATVKICLPVCDVMPFDFQQWPLAKMFRTHTQGVYGNHGGVSGGAIS